MKLKNLTTGCLALASLTLAAFSANAQTQVSYTQDDLFLCFRASAGTGMTSDYLVDIGQASNYTSGNSFTLNLSGVGADLAATFGSNWSTDPNLYWSVVGMNNGANGPSQWGNDPGYLGSGPTKKQSVITAYESKAESALGTLSTPYAAMTESSLEASFGANVANMVGWPIDNGSYLYGANQTPNVSTTNNQVGLVENASSVDSYSSLASGMNLGNLEGNSANGIVDTALDLDRIVAYYGTTQVPSTSTSTIEGTFTIDNSGDVMYAAAVPEPSTYASLGIGAVCLFFMLRRRAKRFAQAA